MEHAIQSRLKPKSNKSNQLGKSIHFSVGCGSVAGMLSYQTGELLAFNCELEMMTQLNDLTTTTNNRFGRQYNIRQLSGIAYLHRHFRLVLSLTKEINTHIDNKNVVLLLSINLMCFINMVHKLMHNTKSNLLSCFASI